ncbi:hypothetical protein KIPB_011755, partial [Kipferlia bialata]
TSSACTVTDSGAFACEMTFYSTSQTVYTLYRTDRVSAGNVDVYEGTATVAPGLTVLSSASVGTVYPEHSHGIPVHETFGYELRVFDEYGNEYTSAPSGVTVSVDFQGVTLQSAMAPWSSESMRYCTPESYMETVPGTYSVEISITKDGTTETVSLDTQIVHGPPVLANTVISIPEGPLAGTSRVISVTPRDADGFAVEDMVMQASWSTKDADAPIVDASGTMLYTLTVPTEVGSTALYVWFSYPDGTGTVDLQKDIAVTAGHTASFTIALMGDTPYGCGVETETPVVLSLLDAYGNAVGDDGRVCSLYRTDCPACMNTISYSDGTYIDMSMGLPVYDCGAGTADIPVTLVTEQGTEVSSSLTVPGSPDIDHTVVATSHIQATAGVSVQQLVTLFDSDGTDAGSNHSVYSTVTLDGVDTSSACTVTDSGAFACES